MTIYRLKLNIGFLLTSMLLSGVTAVLMTSCTHDAFVIVDPNPVDTTGNPIDTTGIPTDTSIGTTCDTNLVYFSRDILPLFISNCAKSGCHDVISHKEGIVMDNFQNVMSGRLVKAFDVNNSKLISVIKANGGEDRMPPSPAQKLNTAQISLISKWIQQGALDLTCDASAGQCITTNVSYSGFVSKVIGTYCVGCHSGGAPSGGISLSTQADVRAMAVSGRLYGAITWATGYKTMPQGSGKLAQCYIDKIKGWIDDGAPNN